MSASPSAPAASAQPSATEAGKEQVAEGSTVAAGSAASTEAPSASVEQSSSQVDEPVARSTARRSALPPTAPTTAAGEGLSAEDAEAAAQAAQAAALQVVYLSIESPSGRSVKLETTPADTVLDLRQFLLECPETAEYTCYHLEHATLGILNDYVELAEYPLLCQPKHGGGMHTLKLVHEPYDDRSIRLHVRRLRELLVRPPANVITTNVQEGYEDRSPEEDAAAARAAVIAAGESSGGKKKNKKNKNKGGKKVDDEFGEFAPATSDASASTSSSTALTLSSLDSFSLTSFFGPAGSGGKGSVGASGTGGVTLSDCVRHLSFSGWNPPPGNRKLQGDLLYLELTTAENVSAFITATPDGFFVNRSSSTSFNPDRSDNHYTSKTLVELLKKISPTFKTRWTKACTRKVTQHPFESMEVGMAAQAAARKSGWLAPQASHSYDWNRSEDALLDTHGLDARGGVQRDWNEEFQSCRELPKSTPAERLIRDRTMYRVYADFVEAATKGAVAVVHGHIPPVNAMDHPRSYVFIYNSIFYSFALDSRDLIDPDNPDKISPAGVDKISHQMANQDLHGVRAYTELDMDELHTLATVLVDYRGHRVIAQSIIPGIFHGDRASKHVYGCMTPGSAIECQPAFHALMSKAAERLHNKLHTVKGPDEKEVELASCLETKGIIGSDGRNYVLDLLRVTPRDANFIAESTNKDSADDEKKDAAAEEEKEKSGETNEAGDKSSAVSSSNGLVGGAALYNSFLLRPELVRLFVRSKAFEQLFPSDPELKKQRAEEEEKRAAARKERREAKKKAAIEQALKEGKPAPEEPEPDSDEAKKLEAEEAEEAAEEERACMDKQYTEALKSIRFNPDALTTVKLGGSVEDQTADVKSLKELATFLKKDVVTKLVQSLRALELSPVDSRHFTTILHEHGVNLRYLRDIITLAQAHHLPHIEAMAIQECVARAAKYIFNSFLRQVTTARATTIPGSSHTSAHPSSSETMYYAPLITKFLNSLFGNHAMGHKLSEEQLETAEKIMAAWRQQEERERREINKQIAEAAAAAAAAANPNAHAEEGHGEEKTEADQTSPAPSSTTPPPSSTSVSKSVLKKKKKKAAAAAAAAAASGDASSSDPSTDHSSSSSSTHPRDIVIRLSDGSRAPTDPLSPANLWVSIRRIVEEKFFWQLPQYQPMTARSKLCLLRNFCLQTGLQIVAKDYDLSPNAKNQAPFTTSDVLDLLPKVKVHLPASVDARDLLESGRAYVSQGQFHFAYQLLSEALNLHHQIYGPMHVDTAAVYATLALNFYHASDYMSAIDFQQRAIIIYERVLGLDSYETAHAHMHQALFLHSAGQSHASVKHIARALYLFELIAGPNHPDTAAAHINSSLLCTEQGRLKEGLRHVEAALERNQLALGPDHSQVALSHHTVAVAHALLGNFRDSVTHEKMSKSIFLSSLSGSVSGKGGVTGATGAQAAKDPRVVRSHLWLEHFTRQAVEAAKIKQHDHHHHGGKGKKGGKQETHAQQQRLNALSAASIMPPQLLGLTSPLTWVSLHQSTAAKTNRMMSMVDIMQLLDASARTEMAKQQETTKKPQAALEQSDKQEAVSEAATTTNSTTVSDASTESKQ